MKFTGGRLGMLSQIISSLVKNLYDFEGMGIILCLAVERRSGTRKVLQKKNEWLCRFIPGSRQSGCPGTYL